MADEARRSRWLMPPAWTTREEIDMSETVTCECGYCRAEKRPRFGLCWVCAAFIAFNAASGYVRFCAECGARVFFDAAGKPVAEAMVPAEALDYFVGHLGGGEHPFCPLDWHEGESTPWCEATGDGVWEDVTCNKDPRECWRAAALAAAEEGAESDGRQAE